LLLGAEVKVRQHLRTGKGNFSTTTHLDGTLLQNHSAGNHDLLVGTSDVKVPPAGVSLEVGDVAAVEGHGHHGEFLDGLGVWLGGRV
jgi:hypothetical protein